MESSDQGDAEAARIDTDDALRDRTVSYTTLEIVSDDRAFIVKDDFHYELTGGYAADIIAMYRHQLTHGEVLARTYLAGVITGLQHANGLVLQRALEEIHARRSKE